MIMRHVMLFIVVSSISFGVTDMVIQYANAKEAPKTEQKSDLVCVTNDELDKIMTEKGYDILLNMTNADGIVESVWTAGQSIIITAAVPNEQKSCLLTNMNKVTYNPKAIEEVWETYKKQTKQRDI